jgi:ribosomal protein S18 acetylase RimI-like enzyme
MEKDIVFKIASTSEEYDAGKRLFKQYVDALGIDLSFQHFDEELNTIAEQYNSPNGALIIAYDNKQAIACTAIRRLDENTGELKRMYVDPDYRGFGLGQKLLTLALDIAKKLGYETIRLDTLADMHSAIKLYRSFGFEEIASYRFNPIKGAIYMEKTFF